MSNKIIINKDYFSNIEKAISSINNFFSSDFKTKDFPDTTDDGILDGGICSCIDSFESVDSRWLIEPEIADEAVDKINAAKEDLMNYSAERGQENFFAFCSDTNNQSLSDLGREYLSFKALQEISDNFPAFEKLLNGIYSFELFTTPSAYKNEIEQFSSNVPTSECEDVMGAVDASIFDPKRYINGLFENDFIDFPEGFDEDNQLERFSQFKDLTDVEIQVTESPISSVQEAAEVNYFTNTKPSHIKYDGKKWVISNQFEKTVDNLISDLRKCNTTDDLKEFFESDSEKYYNDLNNTVAPFILVQAMIKKKSGEFKKYSDSYKSIIKNNAGAKRFENYDIFTTFKADKDGTLKFLEDFLKLRLVNNDKIIISNNTILTIFNIFDSRIYYDIMYNMIPEKEKKDKGMDEDSFVRTKRAGINKNSRASNSYASDVADEEPDNIEKTSSEIKEYTLNMIKSMGDMNISDMMHCEAWHDMLHAEIDTLGDSLYNARIPVSATNEYIGEGFSVAGQLAYEAIMESNDMKKMVTRTTVLSIIAGGFAGAFGLGLVHGLTGGGYTLLELLIARDAGRVGGGIVGNKIAKSLRGKGIKSEIVRDINDVIRCLIKETDEIDKYIVKDLKKRCKTLAESLNFAMKRKKTFDDDQRETLMDLHHSTQRIIAKTTMEDVRPVDLKSVTEIWLKNADKVLKMLLNTTDDEVKAELVVNKSYDLKDGDTSEIDETETTETEETDESGDDDDDNSDNDDMDDSDNEDDEDDNDEDDDPKTLQEALITTARNARKQVVRAVSKVIPDLNSIVRAKERGSLNKNTIKRMYGGIDYKVSSSTGSVYADGNYGIGSGYSTTRDSHTDSKEMRNILNVMKIDNKIFKKSDKKDRWRNKFSDTEFEVLHDMHEKLGDFVSDVRDCVAADDSKADKMLDFVANDAKELISIFEQIKKFESVSPVAEFFADMPDRFQILTETDVGRIPAYMQSRIALSDESGKKKQSTVEEVPAPSDDGNVPSNDVDDMALSIDAKVDAADDMKDLLGKEAKKEGSHIVVNVTNNYSYSNSFNKTSTSNDLSSGKNVTTDQSIHTHKHDLSSNDNSIKSTKDESIKAIKSNDGESNNKYNSTGSANTKEAKKVQEFSTGYSIEDVFAFLESEEPLFEAHGATKPPKETSLTKAMDRDRKKLPKQQAAKKAVDETIATTKAIKQPIVRTKHWLLGIVDSLVRRREDKVKADLIQSPSYRTAVFRAGRIALKAGLVGVAFTINMYLGMAYVALLGSNAYDKQRLRKEVEHEFAVEMRILDDKIRLADQENTPEARRAKWQMMRLRGKMEDIVTKDAMRAKVIHPTSTQ